MITTEPYIQSYYYRKNNGIFERTEGIKIPITDQAKYECELMKNRQVTFSFMLDYEAWNSLPQINNEKPYTIPAMSFVLFDNEPFYLLDYYTPTFNDGIAQYDITFVAREYVLQQPFLKRVMDATDIDNNSFHWEEITFNVNHNLKAATEFLCEAINRVNVVEGIPLFGNIASYFTIVNNQNITDVEEDYNNTEWKNFSYDGNTILEAIQKVAEEYGREWFIDYSHDTPLLCFHTCDLKNSEKRTLTPIPDENNEWSANSIQWKGGEKLPSIIHIFGSEQNCQPAYKFDPTTGLNVAYRHRLQLPEQMPQSGAIYDALVDTGLIDNIEWLGNSAIRIKRPNAFLDTDTLTEKVLTYDDIYPTYKSSIAGMKWRLESEKTEKQAAKYVFTITDRNINHPKKAQRTAGSSFQINFLSGNLQGFTFECNIEDDNDTYCRWSLVPLSIDDNNFLPAPTNVNFPNRPTDEIEDINQYRIFGLAPNVGDEFTILNYIPDIVGEGGEVQTAQKNLITRAAIDILKLIENAPDSEINVNSSYFAEYEITPQIGERYIVADDKFSGQSRVVKIEYNLTTPYNFSLSLQKNNRTAKFIELESQINSVTEATGNNTSDILNIISDGYITNNERARFKEILDNITAQFEKVCQRFEKHPDIYTDRTTLTDLIDKYNKAATEIGYYANASGIQVILRDETLQVALREYNEAYQAAIAYLSATITQYNIDTYGSLKNIFIALSNKEPVRAYNPAEFKEYTLMHAVSDLSVDVSEDDYVGGGGGSYHNTLSIPLALDYIDGRINIHNLGIQHITKVNPTLLQDANRFTQWNSAKGGVGELTAKGVYFRATPSGQQSSSLLGHLDLGNGIKKIFFSQELINGVPTLCINKDIINEPAYINKADLAKSIAKMPPNESISVSTMINTKDCGWVRLRGRLMRDQFEGIKVTCDVIEPVKDMLKYQKLGDDPVPKFYLDESVLNEGNGGDSCSCSPNMIWCLNKQTSFYCEEDDILSANTLPADCNIYETMALADIMGVNNDMIFEHLYDLCRDLEDNLVFPPDDLIARKQICSLHLRQITRAEIISYTLTGILNEDKSRLRLIDMQKSTFPMYGIDIEPPEDD